MPELTAHSCRVPGPVARVTVVKLGISVALAAVVLLGCAGSIRWPAAWAYIAFTTAGQAITVALVNRRHPDLLLERSRMQKGTARWDKILAPIVAIAGPVAMWVVAGLERRFGTSAGFATAAIAIAWVAAAAGLAIVVRAMVENRFFAATVRLQDDRGQRVVATGPYAYVRHPGYTGAGLFTLATPVMLGSALAFVPALATVAALILRTALEDAFLRRELAGYAEYARQVRKRLVPLVW